MSKENRARLSTAFTLILLFTSTLYAAPLLKTYALPPIPNRPGPAVVVDALSDHQLSVSAFATDGTNVRVETRRGSATPDELRDADPSTPQYEIDIRFLDASGFPFLMILGGHSPIDAEWNAGMHAEGTEITPERAASQFAAAAGLIEALEKSDFAISADTSAWAPERAALLSTAAAAVRDAAEIRFIDEPEGAGDYDAKLGDRAPLHVKADATSTTNVYRWSVEIHKQGAFITTATWGDHSATVTRSISKAGVTQQQIVSSNHGTAANLMPTLCSYQSAFTNPRSLPATAMCSTSYGFITGTHVCNDDSYIQYQTIRNLVTVNPRGGTCADNSLRRYAPNCW